MKRLPMIAAAIAIASVCAATALAPVVSANGGGKGDHEHSDHGGDTGKGKNGLPFDKVPGILEADGDGIEAAAGALNLHICADDGLLLVRKGDSTLGDVTSTDSVDWLGLHVYFGFTGCADISGGHAAALVVGKGLTLHAEGFGIAFLKGTGGYTNDGTAGSVTDDGVVLKIGSKLFGNSTKTPGAGTPGPTGTPSPEPTQTPTATPAV